VLSFTDYIQGYPQRMRLQGGLYGICLICFFAFRVPYSLKLPYFCPQSSNKPSNYSFECRNQKSSFKSSYCQSFGSSLQSYSSYIIHINFMLSPFSLRNVFQIYIFLIPFVLSTHIYTLYLFNLMYFHMSI